MAEWSLADAVVLRSEILAVSPRTEPSAAGACATEDDEATLELPDANESAVTSVP